MTRVLQGPYINRLANEHLEAIYELIREFGPISVSELMVKARDVEGLGSYSAMTLQKVVSTAAFYLLYDTYGRVDMLEQGHRFLVKEE